MFIPLNVNFLIEGLPGISGDIGEQGLRGEMGFSINGEKGIDLPLEFYFHSIKLNFELNRNSRGCWSTWF